MRNYITKRICMMIILIVLTGIPLSIHGQTAGGLPSQLILVYHRPKEEPITQWLILVYTEALRRLDIQCAIDILPSVRTGVYASTGRVDGELGRVNDYNSKFPNLVKVEQHNFLVKFSAFVADPSIKIDNWEALKGSTYQVGYLRGGKKVKEQLLHTLPPDQITAVRTIKQAVNMLLQKRIDIVVTLDIPMESYLNSQDYREINSTIGQGQQIHNIAVLEQSTSHAWLHESHRMLAPELSKVLGEMKAEGLYQYYKDQIGAPLGVLEW